jgi:hypothetical protein
VSVPSSELGLNWVCQPSHPQASVPPHCLRMRGWADPVRTTGEKAWHSVYSMMDANLLVKCIKRNAVYRNNSAIFKMFLCRKVHLCCSIKVPFNISFCSPVRSIILLPDDDVHLYIFSPANEVLKSGQTQLYSALLENFFDKTNV